MEIKRPTIDAGDIVFDGKNPQIKELFEKFKDWAARKHYYDEVYADKFENYLVNCFLSKNHDGFYLALNIFHEKTDIVPDENLVYILSDIKYINNDILQSKIKTWVLENNLVIDRNLIGRRAEYLWGPIKKTGIVVDLKPKTYQVLISEIKNAELAKNNSILNHVHRINFENAEIL